MDALALTLIWIAALLLIGCGVIGTVLPALPGSPLIFLGALLVAWWQDFSVIGWVPLSILGALALFSVAVDYVSSALGAKRAGASAVALAGAFIGSFMGFFIGLPGIVLGPFIGALIGEAAATGSITRATQVGFATWLGMLVGTVAKAACVAAMLGVLIAAVCL